MLQTLKVKPRCSRVLRRMVPLAPTMKMSLDEWPQMARRSSVVPLLDDVHRVPFQCRIVPRVPTA